MPAAPFSPAPSARTSGPCADTWLCPSTAGTRRGQSGLGQAISGLLKCRPGPHIEAPLSGGHEHTPRRLHSRVYTFLHRTQEKERGPGRGQARGRGGPGRGRGQARGRGGSRPGAGPGQGAGWRQAGGGAAQQSFWLPQAHSWHGPAPFPRVVIGPQGQGQG